MGGGNRRKARQSRSSVPGAGRRKPIVTRRPPPYTGLSMHPQRQRAIALALICPQLLWAEGNSWNKLRYSGGTVPAKVNPYDWNTTLTVSPDIIRLVFAGRTTLKLTPSQVTALSYGEQAYRRVADMVALSVVFVNPLVLFGILHKSKNHFIGIEFRGDDGKGGAVLLEADKNNYRAILQALKTVTGKPVQNAP